MINIDKVLGQLLNASQGKSLVGGLLVGGLAGALTGKTGQNMAKSALKLGGAAAVAGLAYTAYQRYRASQPPNAQPTGFNHAQGSFPNFQAQPAASAAPATMPRVEEIEDILPPRNSGYLPPPEDTAATEALSLKLIRAMIAAAKADGRIDAKESAQIFGQVDALGFDEEQKSFLLTEISKPLSAQEIAASARSPEEATEIYAISVMTVNPHGQAERGYLSTLANGLKLDPALAQAIEARANAG